MIKTSTFPAIRSFGNPRMGVHGVKSLISFNSIWEIYCDGNNVGVKPGTPQLSVAAPKAVVAPLNLKVKIFNRITFEKVGGCLHDYFRN